MYCAHCATPLAPGLSFCNRCGASLKEPEPPQGGAAQGLLTAVVLVALFGLGIMFAGPLVLKNGAGIDGDPLKLFIVFTFILLTLIEIFLLIQLSHVLRNRNDSRSQREKAFQQPGPLPRELQATPLRNLADPIQSVTENTTRTLEYSRREE
jgi:hypothetical protein